MSDELKPCPFCGRTEAKLTECRAEWAFGWHVTCKHCLSVGATAYSDRVGVGAKTPEEKERQMKAYAVANWNRRALSEQSDTASKKVDDNPPLTLEELRGMDGEPVWIEPMGQRRIVHIDCDGEFVRLYTVFSTISAKGVLNDDGRIYRRKPEEERHE